MDDNSIVLDELSLLTCKVKREVINALDSFLSFLRKYDNRKAHNMVSLMLDPRFKSLCIVSSCVGREQGVVLVEENDRKSLYHLLTKCHEHLHPLVRSNRSFVNQDFFIGIIVWILLSKLQAQMNQ
jgi:hypothetical protein